MSAWKIINESASIVLVGSFNPKIFHPEWFIRKGIVEEWDYSSDDVVNVADMSRAVFSNESALTVLLNQFSLRSQLSSNYLALKDLVTSTFSCLRETPILKMGMNYTAVIKIDDSESWERLGCNLAPHHLWKKAISYWDELESSKQKKLGLWDVTMNIPRPDELDGFIRARIRVSGNPADHKIEFSVNNHVEFVESDDPLAITMVKTLENKWEASLSLAIDLINKTMELQLEKNNVCND